MNPLAWIKPLIAAQGLDVPPELDRMIDKGVQDQGPFRFTTVDRGAKDTERMNSMFPAHRVVAFGRRLGRDGVVCLVVADGDYPKGSVLVLHWDGWPGTEVDEDYLSLAAWAKSAENDILEWEESPSES